MMVPKQMNVAELVAKLLEFPLDTKVEVEFDSSFGHSMCVGASYDKEEDLVRIESYD